MIPYRWCLYLQLTLILSISTSLVHAQTKAFPEAAGYGAYAVGGRGGDVYHVTTLDDDEPGSLRFGIEKASGPRTIVFDISGNIELTSYLYVRTPYMTIAGQTAPGMGICVQNYGLTINADHVILRHLRFRPGDKYLGPHDQGGFTEDALTLRGTNIIADHISTSWGIDENLSCGTVYDSITIQDCIIAEGLHQTFYFHGEYAPDHSGHSMGSLIKSRGIDAKASMHHNLWAHNNNRNPAVGSYEGTEHVRDDVRNNVMYNCGSFGYSSGASKQVDLNYVGNYIIAGSSTSSSKRKKAFDANAPNNMHIFQSGNKIDSDLDAIRDGTNTGWSMFSDTWVSHEEEFAMPFIETSSADQAYKQVLRQAGAFYWNRDSVDQRIIEDVRNGTGEIIDSQNQVGGYPKIPILTRPDNWDIDQDGMPNWWEDENGLDADNALDRNEDSDSNGYTNLEEYLNNIDKLSYVKNDDAAIINVYRLELKNYPNPFNPTTTIEFTLNKPTVVEVSVFDIQGRTIAHLLQEKRVAGKQSIDFHAHNLRSGLYFYKVKTDEGIEIGKMLHVK